MEKATIVVRPVVKLVISYIVHSSVYPVAEDPALPDTDIEISAILGKARCRYDWAAVFSLYLESDTYVYLCRTRVRTGEEDFV